MTVVTAIITGVHILLSLGLVFLILLHSGKGGGLSDMFGGGMGPQSAAGSTLAERNLDRLTIAVAVAFAVTTFVLTFLLG